MNRFRAILFKNIKMLNTKIEEIQIQPPNGLSGDKERKTPIYQLNNEEAVKVASSYLKQGGVIALPTDTVYGLACIANDPIAVQELYRIKGRKNCKPVAICVACIQQLKYWGKADHLDDNFLNLILPGPVTIVLEKSHNLENPCLNPGVSKIGIRIPDFPFIQNICKEIKLPLALTSANKSNDKSSLNVLEFRELWPNISVIFDGGQLGVTDEQRLASTVVDLATPGKFKLLRDGVAVLKTTHILNQFNIISDT